MQERQRTTETVDEIGQQREKKRQRPRGWKLRQTMTEWVIRRRAYRKRKICATNLLKKQCKFCLSSPCLPSKYSVGECSVGRWMLDQVFIMEHVWYYTINVLMVVRSRAFEKIGLGMRKIRREWIVLPGDDNVMKCSVRRAWVVFLNVNFAASFST